MKGKVRIFKNIFLLVTLGGLMGIQHLYAFEFYGHQVNNVLPATQIYTLQTPINQQSLSHNYSELKRRLGQNTITSLYNEKKRFNLDDVGMVLLAQKAAASYSGNADVQQLVTFILLDDLHYDVRLSYSAVGLEVFGVLATQPASSVYLFYQGKKYTALNFKQPRTAGTRKIFSHPVKPSARALSMAVHVLPNLNARLKKRVILWTFRDKYYRIDAVNNLSLAAYLQDLPALQIGSAYVNRPTSSEFETSVISGLRNETDRMTSVDEKVEFLLAFVQGAFRYQTDEQQFGREKYNYPEETLSSDFSDCEDRTLLLAYLYRKILNLNSVGLYFERDKHICLAVAMPGKSNSFTLKYDQQNFVICEPTGTGFKPGDTGLPLSRITEVIPFY